MAENKKVMEEEAVDTKETKAEQTCEETKDTKETAAEETKETAAFAAVHLVGEECEST